MSTKGKSIDRTQISVYLGLGVGVGIDCKGAPGSFWSHVLTLDWMMVAQLCNNLRKNHCIVHLKLVNFIVCKFYLNKTLKRERGHLLSEWDGRKEASFQILRRNHNQSSGKERPLTSCLSATVSFFLFHSSLRLTQKQNKIQKTVVYPRAPALLETLEAHLLKFPT